jgi:hypothetical protein
LKNGLAEGFGFHRYPNQDEYDGMWKENKRSGVAIWKEAATGRIERSIWEND